MPLPTWGVEPVEAADLQEVTTQLSNLMNRLYVETTSHSAAHNTSSTVIFPAPIRNVGPFTYSAVTGILNVPRDGDYEILARGLWASPSASSGATDIYVNIATVDHWLSRIMSRSSDGGKAVGCVWRGPLLATNDVYFRTFQNANGGSALNLGLYVSVRYVGPSS